MTSPFVIFFIGAALAAMVPAGRIRSAVLLTIPVIGALNLLQMADGTQETVKILDYTLIWVRADRLSLLFGYLFHLAAFIGIIYSLHLRDTTEQIMGILYAGSAIGAVFAGDLITLFVFWELLSLFSVFLILGTRSEKSRKAAMRYLIIQVLSGVIMLSGILVRLHDTGSIAFDFIGLGGLGSGLILLAFGIKCAFPLLHNWLTDAYPEATPTGTVFLSAFTTKVAVYALARGFPGTEILVYIGAAMTMFPIFFAVIENDLRRVLSYSMINQIGFMVTGIGIGTALAVNGAVAHAFNDVLFKGLLFMTMGAVIHRTGKIRCSDLGGLYKSMPITTVCCLVGAASISAIPLFSGFVSKSMIMVAALEEGHPMVWLLLLFASAGVMEHAGIKVPFFAFFSHDSGIRCKEAPRNMLIAMIIAAVISVFNGSYPWLLYSFLPFPVDYAPFAPAHVLTQVQLLAFAILAFIGLKLSGLYPPELPGLNIDAEWTYRRLATHTLRRLAAVLSPLDKALREYLLGGLSRLTTGVFRQVGPSGVLARTTSAGSTVALVLAMLAAYLLLYFIEG